MKSEQEKSDHQQIIKRLALLEELETSCKLIRLGFGELQNLGPANDFDFLPFQLLSQGFERLMKAYLCIGSLCKSGKYPSPGDIKGHDLQVLLTEIVNKHFDSEAKPILTDDGDFLCNDQELKELLHILSEFGKRARYYNFDIITGNAKIGEDINASWNTFNNRILTKLNLWDKCMSMEFNHEVFGVTACYTISIMEHFVAALARQFTMGAIQDEGRSLSMPVHDFSMLWPDDIGKTDYRKNTTKYKHTEHHVHKRTTKDEYERRFNSKYKSKKIKKSDYNGEWPFYADEVIIECREKHWCVVTIDGCDYGLNGSAQGRYKLESPHEAGMAILGRSVGDFITMALKLGEK